VDGNAFLRRNERIVRAEEQSAESVGTAVAEKSTDSALVACWPAICDLAHIFYKVEKWNVGQQQHGSKVRGRRHGGKKIELGMAQ